MPIGTLAVRGKWVHKIEFLLSSDVELCFTPVLWSVRSSSSKILVWLEILRWIAVNTFVRGADIGGTNSTAQKFAKHGVFVHFLINFYLLWNLGASYHAASFIYSMNKSWKMLSAGILIFFFFLCTSYLWELASQLGASTSNSMPNTLNV